MNKILLIDDDRDLCNLLERELKKKILKLLYVMMGKRDLMLLRNKIINLFYSF